MNTRELFDKRLLREIPKDPEKVEKSLEIASNYLADAKRLLETRNHKFVILAAYTSMFHAARALLYKDGIQEKSHYAVFIYLKEKYSRQIGSKLLFAFDNAREQRHEGLYGLEYEFNEDDAEHSISVADKFYIVIGKLCKGQETRMQRSR
jgi:uncharacterized protein (UPF0332 family)